jgi:hypothetical protein
MLLKYEIQIIDRQIYYMGVEMIKEPRLVATRVVACVIAVNVPKEVEVDGAGCDKPMVP